MSRIEREAAGPLLGLNVGGTTSSLVVGDGSGRVLRREAWPSRVESGPDAMIEEALRRARAMVAGDVVAGDVVAGDGPALALGVSIGGPLDVAAGVVHEPPNLPGWRAVPLRSILEEALGLPVAIEHDAAACALAEWRWGAGRGASRLGFLTCGSGFGVGLVFDGEAYHGAGGRSIEIGHVRYRDDGPTAFGKRGSFEAYGAGNSLPRLAAWLAPGRWAAEPPSGRVRAARAGAGAAAAAAVLETNAVAVGDASALLADLLGLEVVVIGSLARYLGEPWIATARRRLEAEALPEAATRCRLVPAGLGEGLQDAAALAVAGKAAGLR